MTTPTPLAARLKHIGGYIERPAYCSYEQLVVDHRWMHRILTSLAAPDDSVIEAAEKARKYCEQVQGFHYGDDFVVRDCNLSGPRQEIYRVSYDSVDDVGRVMRLIHGDIINRAALSAAVRAAMQMEGKDD